MQTTSSLARRLTLAVAAPVLAFLTLAAWSISSPVGSSPDEDFHLSSTWCGLGERPGLCENVDGDSAARSVPKALTNAACFAQKSNETAACWSDPNDSTMTNTLRVNSTGLYPPVFYATMALFASSDIQTSVLIMRLLNSAFAVSLITLVFFALPRWMRPALIISVAATVVPLGLFILASINPSSWAILSGATVWICLYGATQTDGRRRFLLSALAIFAAFIGAGARADSAMYSLFSVALAAILGLRLRRDQTIPIASAIVVCAISLVFYLSAWQGASVFTGMVDGNPPLTRAQHAQNLLNIPSLWSGALGGWGLGWLDTPLPPFVSFLSLAVFSGAIFLGLKSAGPRRLIATSLAFLAMWVVPFVLLARSNVLVGEAVQPRYILPLLTIAVGVASVQRGVEFLWSGAPAAFASVFLAVAASIALHTNIQRYTTGIDQLHLDPGSNAVWWWTNAPSPLATWIFGSVAFTGMFAALWFVLRRETGSRRNDKVPRAEGPSQLNEPEPNEPQATTSSGSGVEVADVSTGQSRTT